MKAGDTVMVGGDAAATATLDVYEPDRSAHRVSHGFGSVVLLLHFCLSVWAVSFRIVTVGTCCGVTAAAASLRVAS